MSLLRKIRNSILGPAADLYVDPLLTSERTLEGDWGQAILEYKQRRLALVMHKNNKSLLTGYIPPEPFLADRIDAQATKAGKLLPTEQRRLRNKTTPVKPSLLNVRSSKSANT